MRLANLIGRISFAIGYFVAFWFYMGPSSHIWVPKLLPCLICPQMTIGGGDARTRYLVPALPLGFGNALLFALIGYCIGYGLSKIRKSDPSTTSK